jgi:hypothetical protein
MDDPSAIFIVCYAFLHNSFFDRKEGEFKGTSDKANGKFN